MVFYSQFFTGSNPHVDRCSDSLQWDPFSSPQILAHRLRGRPDPGESWPEIACHRACALAGTCSRTCVSSFIHARETLAAGHRSSLTGEWLRRSRAHAQARVFHTNARVHALRAQSSTGLASHRPQNIIRVVGAVSDRLFALSAQAALLKGGCPLRLICPFTFPIKQNRILKHRASCVALAVNATTNKQTSKQASKQTNKQASKQPSK